jgi:hypothetical protein
MLADMSTDPTNDDEGLDNLTPLQEAYCSALAISGAETAAAHSIGWSLTILRKEKQASKPFRTRIKMAMQEAADRLVMELSDRAYKGESLPAINQGVPVYRREPSTGEIMLDDDFEPIVLVYRKHDKAYLFKLMDVLMPHMRQGGTNINIGNTTDPDMDAEKAVERSDININLIMPKGRDEAYYDAIENGEGEPQPKPDK